MIAPLPGMAPLDSVAEFLWAPSVGSWLEHRRPEHGPLLAATDWQSAAVPAAVQAARSRDLAVCGRAAAPAEAAAALAQVPQGGLEGAFVTPGVPQPFDQCDVQERCRELLRRLSLTTPSGGAAPPWKWDILELLEASREALRDIRRRNCLPDGAWQELSEAIDGEHGDASSLPVGLRKQCEELLSRREMWLGDFDAELRAVLARGREIRERLLFEDVDRAGWFSAPAGVSPLEVQRLLERHLDMHRRGARLLQQLQLLGRALRQQGAVSSRRRAFQARSVSEKLQSSLVCLAAVAVAPVPGSSEMWLAATTMMWLDKDQAWQHAVYEHPRDAEEAMLKQFQCSSKAREALASYCAVPPEKRRGCVLIHNASVRRVILKTHLVNCIDGQGDSSCNYDWTSALDAHPLGSVMKRALTLSTAGSGAHEDKIVIAAQRLAVVQLPPKPDANWSWRGLFAYEDTKVGECALREGGVFSFICVDCGLRVGDRGEENLGDDGLVTAQEPRKAVSLNRLGSAVQAKEADPAGDDGRTTLEVVNRMDETVQVKVFAPGGGHASMLFRRPIGEGAVSPGVHRLFSLRADRENGEVNFDVEIRLGRRLAKCEVVGEQVIFVDGMFTDG